MHNDESVFSPLQLALQESKSSAKAVLLINEALFLLSQKRRTLEEKIIFSYFYRLVCLYGGIISRLNAGLALDESLSPLVLALLVRLRTVNENVSNCVQELLKILKYDLNYLEQYFEYDFCSRITSRQDLAPALEAILIELPDAPLPAPARH